MPPVAAFVYGIGSALAAIFVTSLGWAASVAIGSVVLALTVAGARRAAKLNDPSDAGYSNSQSVSIRSTEAPRNIVYGEANVGGVFAFVNSAGTELRSLYYELIHTGHEVDSYSGWYLDDKYVPVADVDVAGDGSVDTNTGGHGLDDVAAGPVLYLRGALGTDAQAVDSMLDTAFTDIGTNHRHRGCARTVIRCDLLAGYEDKWNGRPPNQITAVIKGKKVYDPRLDTTFPGGAGAHRLATPSTWAWSDNPALIWADYRITAPPLGPGWSSARINYQSVFDAANHCNTLVAIPTATTEKRFRCDLVVDTSMEPREVVSQILATMDGSERQIAGLWNVYAGVWPTPDFTLDEGDLVGPIQFRKEPDTGSADRYNQVKGEYFDRDRQWKLSPFITVNNTTLRTNRDNARTFPKHLRLDGVSREYQAQRLAIRALNQADDSGILVFSAGYSAANIRVGDTGTVTISEFGWSAKSFRCVGVKQIDFLGYELKLKEDASGNYTDPIEAEYSTRTAAGDIVFGTVLPWYLATPAGVWSITCTFSTTDADTVAWTSGTLYLVNGSTYSISSGNTGNMGARTYIYFSVLASSTVLQTTTTASSAIGTGKALIAVAAPSTDANVAFFQVFNGAGGLLARTNEIGSDAATEVYQITTFGTQTDSSAPYEIEDQVASVVVSVDSIVYIDARCNSCTAGASDVATWTPFVGGTDGQSITTDDGTTIVDHPISVSSFAVTAGTYDIGMRATSTGTSLAINDRFITITIVKR